MNSASGNTRTLGIRRWRSRVVTTQGQWIGNVGDRTQSDGIHSLIGQDSILQLAKSSSALVLKRKFSRFVTGENLITMYSTGKQIRKFVRINPQIPSPQISLVPQSANRKSAKLQEKAVIFYPDHHWFINRK
jgi:hypothetical protein